MNGGVVKSRLAGIAGALSVATVALWASFGSIHVASSKETAAIIARAHDGEHQPSFTKPIFVLVLGGDARAGNPQRVRTDSIHVVSIDPVSMRASLVGIPRDSYVSIPGHGMDRINAAGFFGGPRLVTQTVEQLSGCRFDYYMLTNFRDFVRLVDDFGGVTFTVKQRMFERRSSHINLFPGTQVLTGTQALAWARNRHNRPRGDFDRSLAQGELIVAALREAKKDYAERPGTALRDLAALLRHVRLDIPIAESFKLGLLALQVSPENVANIVLDGASADVGGASVVRISARGTSQLRDVCDDGILQNL